MLGVSQATDNMPGCGSDVTVMVWTKSQWEVTQAGYISSRLEADG